LLILLHKQKNTHSKHRQKLACTKRELKRTLCIYINYSKYPQIHKPDTMMACQCNIVHWMAMSTTYLQSNRRCDFIEQMAGLTSKFQQLKVCFNLFGSLYRHFSIRW